MRFHLAFLLLGGLAAASYASSQMVSDSIGQRLAADLTWSQPERDARFAAMETMFPVHVVRAAGKPLPLPPGPALIPVGRARHFLKQEHLSGLLIVRDGRIRNEAHGLRLTPAGHWTSFSMTKAVTDTLAGAALKNGTLHSLDDAVTTYLPEMRGSVYGQVTVRQLMTMTTGVRWNENYTSPDADNVRLYTFPAVPGKNSTVEYMRTLQRDAAPGSRWHYNTGETDLLGVLLQRAAGQSLAAQLSAAIWRKAGMQNDATWIASAEDPAGQEFGGSGLSASLRDFGRLGLWVLRGGDGAVPTDWFAQATTPQVKAGNTAYGYGWWPQPDGSFAALGIFGQSLLMDPKRKLVIVMLGDWDKATSPEHAAARTAFWNTVKAAADREAKR